MRYDADEIRSDKMKMKAKVTIKSEGCAGRGENSLKSMRGTRGSGENRMTWTGGPCGSGGSLMKWVRARAGGAQKTKRS